MKTKTINLYTFAELSEEAKSKAINADRETQVFGNWWKPIYEGFTEEMKEIGFQVTDIKFSGFWSQGDGASFEGQVTDLTKFAEVFPYNYINPENLSIEVVRSNAINYVHENMMDTNVNIYSEAGLTAEDEDVFINTLEPLLNTYFRRIAQKLYKDLETYYNELTSDAAVIERLTDCKFYFDENGNETSEN